jgi:GT2 family glycosyltransferase/glycosyltransferase involved in cell wall biosynthesis
VSERSGKREAGSGHESAESPSAASALKGERAVVIALRAQLTSVTEWAWQTSEKAQRRLYEAYSAEDDPLQTGRDHPYRKMVSVLREMARQNVPRDATVIVLSRGDEDLVDLYGREAWHFPRQTDGRFAGHYPDNGVAAVAQLESQLALGGRFLLVPATSAWWLDHYPELGAHLRAAAGVVASEEGIGQLFDLSETTAGSKDWLSALEGLLAEIESVEGTDPSVLDLTELELSATLPHRAVFAPIPGAGAKLPYVDGGADVVLVTSGDERQAEAVRIARTAVLELQGEEATTRRLEVKWQEEQTESGQPLVSIVIPCGGPHDRVVLERVLRRLPESLGCEVFAATTGRQPAWLRSLSRTHSGLEVVRAQGKTLAAAYDAGAQAARGETLVLLRNDVIPLPGWLPPLLRVLRTTPDAHAVGGLVLSPSGCIAEAGGMVCSDGATVRVGAGDYKISAPPYSFVREVDFCSAGPLATRRQTFLRVGGLDLERHDAALAFADLCLRAGKRGGRVYFQPESASVALDAASLLLDSRNGRGEADREVLRRRRRSSVRRAVPLPGAPRPRARSRSAEPHRALVVSRRPPEYDRESGSRRLFHLIQVLRDAGWSVTFGADEDYGAERGIRRLQQVGVETYVPMRDRLEQLLVPGRFDLALIAFWQNAEALLPQIRRTCPDTRVIVDMIDLHFLREARSLFNRPNMLLDQEFAFNTAREINTYALADVVLAVSAKEAGLVNDLINARRAFVVPDFEELPGSAIRRQERRGIDFIGNFWHPPNRDALRFLFHDIIPRLDRHVLEEHPIRVIGNKLEEALSHVDPIPEGVELVGWTPSVVPYLESARVSVIPLRTGAGTKRKLVQALMIGTPTVSTSIGIEGIPVEDGEHVLVADDPDDFAKAVERLLIDDPLWDRLCRQGREIALAGHGPDAVEGSMAEALNATFSDRSERTLSVPLELARSAVSADYDRTLAEVREAVREVTSEDSVVYVVNRGDAELLDFEGRVVGRHFPEGEAGAYAGYHPADSEAAIALVHEALAKGAEYLVIPGSAFWWLGRYPGFEKELESLGGRAWSSERCIVYSLSSVHVSAAAEDHEPAATRAGETAARDDAPEITPEIIEARRPTLAPVLCDRLRAASSPGTALVTGIYLADRPTAVVDIAARLAQPSEWEVQQRWIALGGDPPTAEVADVTARVARKPTPKFELLNAILADENLDDYDYVLVMDDDVVVPNGFIDALLTLQRDLGFALAQPARTSNSYIDHPIVEQQRGALARQTHFVEIGPVFSVHRTAYDLVFPFDLTSPMGWGYENVWAYEAEHLGLKLGILDAVPVDHSLRKPVAYYSWHDANGQRDRFLARNDHLPIDQCFRVLDLVSLDAEVFV